MDCSLPGFSVHGILQARVLEWVAISFSRASSQTRDRTRVSHIAGKCFNLWATKEAPNNSKPPPQIWSCLLALELKFTDCLSLPSVTWGMNTKPFKAMAAACSQCQQSLPFCPAVTLAIFQILKSTAVTLLPFWGFAWAVSSLPSSPQINSFTLDYSSNITSSKRLSQPPDLNNFLAICSLNAW